MDSMYELISHSIPPSLQLYASKEWYLVHILFGVVLIAILFLWNCRQKRLARRRVLNNSEAERLANEEISNGDSTSDQLSSHYRFRKRDKVMFYGKKIIRKVKNLPSTVGGTPNKQLHRREQVLRFAKKLLRFPRHQTVRPAPKRPSPGFFEPDTSKFDGGDPSLPQEVLYMLKNIRVFGHFETPFFLEICRHIQTIKLPAGQFLFRPGDHDDAIFVIQEGLLSVAIKVESGKEVEVKKVSKGESVFSLLSILDVLTGHPGVLKTVSAVAVKDSTILRLGAEAFTEIFERYPESWVRAVQIIMTRLHRVTFTTLHTYLGLSTELIKPTLKERRSTLATATAPSAPHTSEAPGRISSGHYSHRGSDEIDRGDDGGRMNELLLTDFGLDSQPTDVGIKSHDEEKQSSGSFPSEHRCSLPQFELAGGERQNFQLDRRDSSITKTAKSHIAEALGTSDLGVIEDTLKIQSFAPGTVLIEEGSVEGTLIYVVSGTLELSQKAVDDHSDTLSCLVHSHELVGGLAVLTGEPSVYTVKTRQFSRVIQISKQDFYRLMPSNPKVVLKVAHSILMRLSPFVRSIDFALDWEMMEAGHALYKQDEHADSLYVVLSGRLRSVAKKEAGLRELVEEYGRGDLIGLVEVLTQKPRSTTVMAIRYSELAKLPEGLLSHIKLKYPQVLTRMIRLLGQCVHVQQQKFAAGPSVGDTLPNISNLNTIAVMGVSPDVPLSSFTFELWHTLSQLKPTLRLSSQVILNDRGPTALETANQYRLHSWLSEQEEAYSIVLYQCDFELTTWTRRCIRQADCILIVAMGQNEPTVGPVEKQLDQLAVRAQKELILLWREGVERPTRTAEWLDVRDWVSSHYHIRCPNRMFVHKSYTRLTDMYNKIFQLPADKFSDFSRLARMLTGNSIGLVLGGGGARGAAHIGILKAMKDFGVPIDIVGGVSIGSFIGALYCENPDLATLTHRARDWFKEMTSYWAKILDLTYPASAIFTGAGFNRTLKKTFLSAQIEDLWLPYFNVTTDITASEMRIHRSGDLWMFVRSSMSYPGIFPPLCDPADGHYLVDGCYINNLPADVMRSMGVLNVIAVDVGGQDERNLTNYGDSLSGWWVLWHRWCPWAQPIRVLSMDEIQSRLAYVSCMRQLEQVKKAPYCSYIRPPIDRYQTLDFGLFDEIYEVGYQHAKALLDVWLKSNKLAHILQPKGDNIAANAVFPSFTMSKSQVNLQNTSFTDLAALCSKIQPISSLSLSDVSEAEDSDIDPDDSNLSELNSEDDGLKLQFNNDQTSTDDDEDTEEIVSQSLNESPVFSHTPTPNLSRHLSN